MFGSWLMETGEALSADMDAIMYENLTLTDGSFTGSDPEQVQGRFYGQDHAEVGGFFNTMTVTGVFGGRRQSAQ